MVVQHWPADRDQVATPRNGKTVLAKIARYFSRSVAGVTLLPPKKTFYFSPNLNILRGVN